VNEVNIKLYCAVEQIRALSSQWNDLTERCVGRSFFQSPAWCLHVLSEIAHTPGENSFEPIVATAWHGETLIALWPLSVQRESGLQVVKSLADPFDQYTDILIDPNAIGAEVLTPLISSLREKYSVDGMVLRKVRTTSIIQNLSQNGAGIVDEGSSAPQIEFGVGQSFAQFLTGVKSKTRKNIRNYRNRLMREGKLEHSILKGSKVAAAVEESFSVRRQWLDDTGQSSAGFRNANFERMSSRDPNFESYSVGRIHLQLVLEECHKMGASSVDLMVPSVPYKLSWATSTDSVVDLIWPWSIRARLQMGVVEQHIRPGLKKIAKQLPPSLQRKLIAGLNAPSSNGDSTSIK